MKEYYRHTIIAVLCVVALASAVSCGRGQVFYDEAYSLLQELDMALAGCQNTDAGDDEYGGLTCPRCGEYHTRSAEAVFPFAYEGICGDTLRLRQAILLGDWLLRKQNDDGSWTESPRTGWTGTTADQLLSLALAYPIVKSGLTFLQRSSWENGMRGAADYLAGFMSIDVAYVNYCATTAYALAAADDALHDSAHLDEARRLAHFCVSQINEDGLLEGEGDRCGDTKTGIDIGYNMEMSLWGLLGYACLSEDRDVRDAVLHSFGAHSPFIYPDGWLDCSAGLRSCKWTLYGSATADGALPLYAGLAGEDPSYLRIALDNVRALERCISSSGFLAPGPDYDKVSSDSPCIYHSFARAKGIAMALRMASADPMQVPACYDKDTLVYFKSLNSVVVKRGPVKATICGYGYKSDRERFMHRPSGGAVTMLWREGRGVVQASSPNRYFRWEDSFPEMPEDSHPLTSRIEYVKDGVVYTNLYEYDVALEVPDQWHVAVRGLLKNERGEPCGVDYEIRYSFDGEGLEKEYRVTGADVTVIEPVADPEGDTEQYYPSLCCRDDIYGLKASETLKIKY